MSDNKELTIYAKLKAQVDKWKELRALHEKMPDPDSVHRLVMGHYDKDILFGEALLELYDTTSDLEAIAKMEENVKLWNPTDQHGS